MMSSMPSARTITNLSDSGGAAEFRDWDFAKLIAGTVGCAFRTEEPAVRGKRLLPCGRFTQQCALLWIENPKGCQFDPIIHEEPR
jgi:hypothetical protein